MADIPASNWTEADASNSTAAPDGWPEGMAPSGVNDSGRAMMGAVKRWYDWTVPLVTGGTSTAYTLSYAVAPGALVDGMSHLVQFNAVNGAAATLNVNALGAKPLHFYAGSAWGACPANMFAIDQIVRVTYNAAAGTYRCIDTPMVLNQSVSGVTAIDFTGIPTNVTNLDIRFDLLVGTNSSNIGLRFYNSSGVLDTGASAYYYAQFQLASSGSTGTNVATTSSIIIGNSISNSSSIGCVGDIAIQNIQGVKVTQCNYRYNFQDAGGVLAEGGFGYGARTANGNITGFRLFSSSGTFSGLVTVRAI
jgi:hypothetical protein